MMSKLHCKYTVKIIICLALLGLIGLLGFHEYRQYTGPVLEPHSEIGFYGHHHLAILKASGSTERSITSKIYISKSKMDWHKPIKRNGITIYFPKNMPVYTRNYLVSHVAIN